MYRFPCLVLAGLVAMTVSADVSPCRAGLRAGVAKTDITHPEPTQDVDDPLMARALVLDDGATKVAILAVDMVGVEDELVAAVRSGIERRTGIRAAHVLSSMHSRVRPNLVNFCGGVEFAWNTEAPGSELFDRSSSSVLHHEKEPRVIFEKFVPRACRNVWGPEAGPLMAPLFQNGLNAAILVRTQPLLRRLNRARRRGEGGSRARFTAAIAREQVEAAESSLPGVEQVVHRQPEMDPYALKAAVYYYRRVRVLHVIAQVHYHVQKATELADAGRNDAAIKQVEAGRELLETELPRLRQMARQTAQMPNLTRDFVEGRKDVYTVLLRRDVDFDTYREALAGLEQRLKE